MTAEHLGSWKPYPVRDLPGLLRAATFPWWVAGGWALDLFVGRQTREHGDTDIEMLRRDQRAVQGVLPGWDIQVASGGKLRPLGVNEWLSPGDNSLWCWPANDAPWALQIMLTESDNDTWIYRRNADIRRPIAEIGLVSPEGIPCLAPEIQLLYKAKVPRLRDEADLEMVMPQLDLKRYDWLATALRVTHPDHRWLTRLNVQPRV